MLIFEAMIDSTYVQSPLPNFGNTNFSIIWPSLLSSRNTAEGTGSNQKYNRPSSTRYSVHSLNISLWFFLILLYPEVKVNIVYQKTDALNISLGLKDRQQRFLIYRNTEPEGTPQLLAEY